MDKKQVLGLIGSIFLFIGVFSPIASVSFMWNVNYLQSGKSAGCIVLVLALISIILTLTEKYRWLWFTGLGSLEIIVFSFINLQVYMSKASSEIQKLLAGNTFLGGLGELALQSVQLQWGWALLILGVIFVISAAAIKTKTPAVQDEFKKESLSLIVGRYLAFTLGIGALIGIGYFCYIRINENKTSFTNKAKEIEHTVLKEFDTLLQESNSKHDYDQDTVHYQNETEVPNNLPDIDKAIIYYNQGYDYYKEGKYDKSIEALQNSLKYDIDNENAHYGIGNSYYRTQRYEKAIECYNKAIEINPDFANAHYGLGTAYSALRKTNEADKEFAIYRKLKAELLTIFNKKE